MGQLAQVVDWSAESGVALRARSEAQLHARSEGQLYERSESPSFEVDLSDLSDPMRARDDAFDPPTPRFLRDVRNGCAKYVETFEIDPFEAYAPYREGEEAEEPPPTLRSPGWVPAPPSQSRPTGLVTRDSNVSANVSTNVLRDAPAIAPFAEVDLSSEIRAERSPRARAASYEGTPSVATSSGVAARASYVAPLEPLPASLVGLTEAW